MIKPLFQKRLPKQETYALEPMLDAPATNALQKQIRQTDLSMNWWHRFRFNRQASELTAQKLGEITVTIVEKQRAEICQKLMLDLDIQKKRAYQEYMEKVGFLNKELVEKSNTMERELRDTLRAELSAIASERIAWLRSIEDASLPPTENEKAINRVEEWMAFAEGQVEGKISSLIETHSKSLQVTLELLRDRAIDGRSALDL